MNQLEYVIEELERALRVWLYERTDRNLMLVQPDVVEDALAILKALAASRQARVIRKDELASLPEGCVVWHETNDTEDGLLLAVLPMQFEKATGILFGGAQEPVIDYTDGFDLLREYGKGYRLWTAWPTDEQRREEKWN